MCADMFKRLLLKNKSVKRSQNKTEEKTRKERSKGQRRNLKRLITELISAAISQPIIIGVNVEGVVSLTRDQIRYLREMAKNGKISEKALSTIESTFQVF